jgi:hypothetical protein
MPARRCGAGNGGVGPVGLTGVFGMEMGVKLWGGRVKKGGGPRSEKCFFPDDGGLSTEREQGR